MNKFSDNNNDHRESLLNLSFICLSIAIIIAFFVSNLRTPFMMDDLWYATNLATGEPLHSFSDIIESQIWHYMNWGGRSITHALLQLTLMSGEHMADLLNTCAFVLLGLIASLFVEKKNRIPTFSVTEALLIFSNPDIFHSMLWQAGAVNYVYSSAWILLFIYIYIQSLRRDSEKSVLLTVLIVPLSVITGWSNENMGPAAFCLACLVIFLHWKKKQPIKPWMIIGALGSLIGSALCILAPGNFVRSEFVEAGSLKEILIERFLIMYAALCSWLLPVALIVAVLIAINKKAGNLLKTEDYLILTTAALAYGAMAISPHFPARASFGIMVLLALEAARLLAGLIKENKKATVYVLPLYFVLAVTDILLLTMGG